MSPNLRPFIILMVIILILLIPLIAMQFTDEVNWTKFDFLVMGTLLFGAGALFEIILRFVKKSNFRIILILLLLATFFFIWVELAVGIL
jgi:hypothetical protein